MSTFYEVSKESLFEYVRDYELTEVDEQSMHRFWVNKSGEIMARIMHGFFSNVYEIRDEPNEQTLRVVSNTLNKI